MSEQFYWILLLVCLSPFLYMSTWAWSYQRKISQGYTDISNPTDIFPRWADSNELTKYKEEWSDEHQQFIWTTKGCEA
jgi:hypothetical protein